MSNENLKITSPSIPLFQESPTRLDTTVRGNPSITVVEMMNKYIIMNSNNINYKNSCHLKKSDITDAFTMSVKQLDSLSECYTILFYIQLTILFHLNLYTIYAQKSLVNSQLEDIKTSVESVINVFQLQYTMHNNIGPVSFEETKTIILNSSKQVVTLETIQKIINELKSSQQTDFSKQVILFTKKMMDKIYNNGQLPIPIKMGVGKKGIIIISLLFGLVIILCLIFLIILSCKNKMMNKSVCQRIKF